MTTSAPTRPRYPAVDGKPIAPVDLFEAEIVKNASWLSLVEFIDGLRSREDRPWNLAEARGLVAEGGRRLVYAVTAAGRSCCVTARVLKVYDTVYPEEREDGRNGTAS